MEDLRDTYQNKRRQSLFFNGKLFTYLRKNYIKILLGVLIILVLLYPTYFGGLIGNWINDFFGTIIKSISIK